MQEKRVPNAVRIVLLSLVLASAVRAEPPADPKVDEVVRCLQRNVPKQSSSNDARLVSTDGAGGTREFAFRFTAKRMPDGLRRAKICVTAPPDLRGAQVLTMENEGGLPESFLYTEELHTPKRITGAGRGGGIFGTDFTFEDFERFMNLNRTDATRRLPDAELDGRTAYVLESTPLEPDQAHYSKVKSWIDPATCVVVQAEFYAGSDQPKRRLQADRVIAKDGLSYPSRVTLRDLADGTQTTLQITAAEIDGAIVTDQELEVGELGRYCR